MEALIVMNERSPVYPIPEGWIVNIAETLSLPAELPAPLILQYRVHIIDIVLPSPHKGMSCAVCLGKDGLLKLLEIRI